MSTPASALCRLSKTRENAVATVRIKQIADSASGIGTGEEVESAHSRAVNAAGSQYTCLALGRASTGPQPVREQAY